MDWQQPDRVALGASGLRVSRVGVGTNSWGSNTRPDPALRTTFDAAVGAGIDFFDTAEVYTLGGSERTLGEFLPTADPRPAVATKFFPYPWRFHQSSLTAALRASLARLKMAPVDLYLIHFPLPPVAIETWMDALAEAKRAGLVRAVGVSNYSAAQMRTAQAALAARGIALACNEVEYSLLKRDVEQSGLLALCRELDVTPIAYRPLASGLLTGKYTRDNPPGGWRRLAFSRTYLDTIQPLIALLRRIGEARGGKTSSQVALNWLVCKGALPIPGAKSVRQAHENAGALGWRLTDEEIAALDRASEQAR